MRAPFGAVRCAAHPRMMILGKGICHRQSSVFSQMCGVLNVSQNVRSLSDVRKSSSNPKDLIKSTDFMRRKNYTSSRNLSESVAPSFQVTEEYTASDAFFEALIDSGVQAVFVNLGSDHPSLLEAILKGQRTNERFPQIYTCPNEMVAVSMADGWARATGKPQAVIVHVDVGTQAIAAAMHNANTGRAPVLIFAGLCPYTDDGYLSGSRTEYQHWLQDAPNQKAIVADYCRFTGDFQTGRTVKQMVYRAMQLATSDPKGPAYLTGAREVMAENIVDPPIDEKRHGPIGPAALPQDAIEKITHALVSAKKPLVITGYSGRNHACPEQLVRLADSIPGLRVLDTGGCDMCFPANHPSYVAFRLSFDPITTEADVIFVLDCDVPWIPSRNPPRKDCKLYHVDVDPLNSTIGFSAFPADGRWKADSFTALSQMNQYLDTNPALQKVLQASIYQDRRDSLLKMHAAKLENLSNVAAPSDEHLNIHQVGSHIKNIVPDNTVFVVEAATCAMPLSDQLQVHTPGSWINSGGAGLGWSGGAALGVKLAYNASGSPKFVCQIVGDGTFLFSVPSSVYWIASRYDIPVLTVVLNNKGWNAPRRSHELVHPHGLGATATNKEMHISLDPPPDYGGIAKAATGSVFGSSKAGLFVGKACTASEFEKVLKQAVKAVQDGRGAVVEAVLSVNEMGESLI